jgi:hypothetical protein
LVWAILSTKERVFVATALNVCKKLSATLSALK